jgi:hypothetical protein
MTIAVESESNSWNTRPMRIMAWNAGGFAVTETACWLGILLINQRFCRYHVTSICSTP